MRKISFFLIFLITALSLCAQQGNEAWWIGKPIADVRFEGLEFVQESTLRGISESIIGKEYSDALFRDFYAKLYAQDLFETMEPNAVDDDGTKSQVAIVITVKEYPLIDKISFEGNNQLKASELLETILTKSGEVLNKTRLRLDTDALRALYIEKGYPDIQISSEIIEVEGESYVEIRFDIDEGKQTRVTAILFSGNDSISGHLLKQKLKTKEQSLLSKGIFLDSSLEEDVLILKQFYGERGYIDIDIVDVVKEIDAESDSDRNEMTITFYLYEGEQYTFGNFEFSGNTIFSTEELMAEIKQETGKLFNITKHNADLARIRNLYYNEGYVTSDFRIIPVRDEEQRSISYRITITESDRAHIENIIIQGNEKTKEHVIRREIPLQMGDIFNYSKVIEGYGNLLNLGFFSTVLPETPYGSAEGLIDLIFTVEEGQTTNIDFGVTISPTADSFPLIGFFGWSDSNFRGLGQDFSIRTDLSTDEQSLTFSFSEPWLFEQRISAGIDLSFAHSKETGIYQDILPPVFDDDIPDPFDGHYVFDSDQEYEGTSYEAGDAFPGFVDETVIDTYDLVPDYVEAGGSVPDEYTMDYTSWDISLGLSGGYTYTFNKGRTGFGGGVSTSLEYIQYDPELYRPADKDIRDNLDTWQPISRLWFTTNYDTRNFINNPTKGGIVKQSLISYGGLLPSKTDLIRSETSAKAYNMILDYPIGEEWSLQLILAASTGVKVIFPQYLFDQQDWGINATTSDMLYIDGMTTARGWTNETYQNLEMIWDNWVELRLPIINDYIWSDVYFSATVPFAERADIASLMIDDFLFSTGAGVRLTIPGLPIGLYLTKQFNITAGGIEWIPGDILPLEDYPGSGLNLVITISSDMY